MNDFDFNKKYQFTLESDSSNEQSGNNFNAITDITEQANRKSAKRKLALKVVAVMMCCLILAVSGGLIGAQIAILGNTNQISDTDISRKNNTESVVKFNPSGEPLSLTELFSGANPAVVAISTETTGRNVFGQTVTLPAAGSGFIVSADGYIVTNNHVVENSDSITIHTYDDKTYTAELVGEDSLSDLAVLKIDASGLSYLTFGDSETLQVGEPVVAIGNPLGELANSLTAGYISSLDREINIDGIPRHMLQTDAAVNSGNSGGPLLNMKGQVIGVVSAKSSGMNVEGLGFAIPSNNVKNIVDQLMQGGYISGRAAMGVMISTQYNNNNQPVIYVQSVENGSAAEKAGVKAGDIIISANGKELSSVGELRALLLELSPGDELKLEVQRNGKKNTLTLILDEYKPADEDNNQNNNTPQTPDSNTPDTFNPWNFFPGMEDWGNQQDNNNNNDKNEPDTDGNAMQFSNVEIDKAGNVYVKNNSGDVIYTGKLDKNGKAKLYNNSGKEVGEITVTNNGYSINLY